MFVLTTRSEKKREELLKTSQQADPISQTQTMNRTHSGEEEEVQVGLESTENMASEQCGRRRTNTSADCSKITHKKVANFYSIEFYGHI